MICERIGNQKNIRKSKFIRNIRDQKKTIPSPRRLVATICGEHFLDHHISNLVGCFKRSVKSVNDVIAWIKANAKELEISKIFENQNSCEIFEISRKQYPVLDDTLTICVKHFLCHSISNHVRCFARSVEDLQYALTDFYLVIVDCLESPLIVVCQDSL